MISAGLLNEIIEIYKVEVEKDEYGAQEEKLVLRTKTRANIINSSGNRQIENDEIVHNYQKSFKVRHYVKVEDFDKVLWKGKYYRVLSIDDVSNRMEKTINTEIIND